MKPTGPVAFGYARVSTTKQADEGVSLDAQKARIAAWAKQHGYQLRAMEVDAGISGRRADNRPALQRALEGACREKGALVVYDLSRLARSLPDAVRILERLTKAKASLVCLTEGIDTNSVTGELIFNMLSAVNQFVLTVTKVKTREAIRHKQANGEYIGGQAPYGYRARDGELEPIADEQRVIGMIRQLSGLHEVKPGEIARRLNSAQVPCRGSAWHSNTVVRILGRQA